VPNVNVRLEADVFENSGGHQHPNAPNRPKGNLGGPSQTPHVVTGNTETDGFVFTFTAPAAAGDHPISATCTDRTCTQEGPRQVWVGIKNLQPLQADPSYVLIQPNADQNHPSNQYVTNTTQRKIRSLATDYHNWFPNDSLLHLNDASLVRGGLFDLGANWSSQPRGHKTHSLGTDIDVRANEFYHDPNESIPSSNYVDLMNTIAPDNGCDAQIHSGATPNEHFHLYCR
jgi:hypothetical protein